MGIQKRVAVVGAGISGLAVARGLKARGVPCTLYEATSRPGGVMRSGRREGRLLEWGPQRLRLTGEVRQLVEDLGLAAELLVAPADAPLYVVRGGHLHAVPRSTTDLLRGTLLTPAGRLRVLMEPVTPRVRPSETVAAALRRKFGDEAYRVLLGPLFGGLYASDPANMRCAHSLSGLLARAGSPGSLLVRAFRLSTRSRSVPACTFREGVQALPDAIARALGPTLRLDAPVRGVQAASEGWRLAVGRRAAPGGGAGGDTEPGGGEGAEREGPFSEVVLAVPAGRAARILGPAVPDAARRLRRLTYNRLAVVHMAASGRPHAGLGYQVAFGESMETRGVTFNDALFGRDDVVTAFLGGARNVRLPDWPDEEIAAVAAREFERVTGRGARALEVSRPVVPAYDTSWEALDDLRLPPGLHLCAGYVDRAGVGGRLEQAVRLVRKLVA